MRIMGGGLGSTVFACEPGEPCKLPVFSTTYGEKSMADENKRKYYLVQFEKIYKALETDQEFINMVHDLVEANVEWEMAHCPFKLSKENYESFKIQLWNIELGLVQPLIAEFLNGKNKKE